MNYLHIAEDLVKQDFMKDGWSAQALAIWLRDGCRCVYCGKDLLESRDLAYYGCKIDALLPTSKYEEVQHEDWNCVLSCRGCGIRKSDWDPNTSADDLPVYVKGSKSITDPERCELIARARTYLMSRKLLEIAKFEKERNLIVRTLGSLGRIPRTLRASA